MYIQNGHDIGLGQKNNLTWWSIQIMEPSLHKKNTGPIFANGNLRIQQRTRFVYNTILRYKYNRKHALKSVALLKSISDWSKQVNPWFLIGNS